MKPLHVLSCILYYTCDISIPLKKKRFRLEIVYFLMIFQVEIYSSLAMQGLWIYVPESSLVSHPVLPQHTENFFPRFLTQPCVQLKKTVSQENGILQTLLPYQFHMDATLCLMSEMYLTVESHLPKNFQFQVYHEKTFQLT